MTKWFTRPEEQRSYTKVLQDHGIQEEIAEVNGDADISMDKESW